MDSESAKRLLERHEHLMFYARMTADKGRPREAYEKSHAAILAAMTASARKPSRKVDFEAFVRELSGRGLGGDRVTVETILDGVVRLNGEWAISDIEAALAASAEAGTGE